MNNKVTQNFKTPLRKILGRYYYLVVSVIFIAGMAIKLISLGKTGIGWQISGDIGTFFAIAVAIPFLYDKLIKTEDRSLFLSDLNDLLDTKLAEHIRISPDIELYENGRRSLNQKADFIKTAKFEVIELGFGLRTFSTYFEQRAAYEYKDCVKELLQRGVSYICLCANPNSKVIKKYAEDREEVDYLNNINSNLNILKKVRDEFEILGVSGKFELYLYKHFPYFNAVCIDGNKEYGKMFITPYIFGIKRAEMPGFIILKSKHPIMFDKYWSSVKKILENSIQI